MIAAAGFPEYLIAHYGGWCPDSKSMRKYTAPTLQSATLVSAHMAAQAFAKTSEVYIRSSCSMSKNI
jgi:hypothetical protein